jgi:hypothetical protein
MATKDTAQALDSLTHGPGRRDNDSNIDSRDVEAFD